MLDLELLLQEEATQGQYIFNFVLMNIIFLFSYLFRKNKMESPWVWVLIVVFLLFAYWDTDYFSFRESFYVGLKNDFRDPLYYYLSLISCNSYTIFRFIIWGSAFLLFYKTIKRLNLSINYSYFIFSVFFLLVFSYARVSLGMAMYFYGLSFLLQPNNKKKQSSYIVGVIMIACSYFGHRSMALPIVLTPLIFLNFNKYTTLLLLISGLVIGRGLGGLLTGIAEGNVAMISEMNEVGTALESYSAKDAVVVYNWKYTLTQNLKNIALIIAYIYLIWKCHISKCRNLVAEWCKRLLNVCTGIVVIAVSFLMINTLGAGIVGYRFLYMIGIPMVIMITYLYCSRLCRSYTIYLLLLPMLLFSEGFILGKILSF